MPLNDIVNVVISRRTGGVSKTGFGTMLIFGFNSFFAENEYVRSYSSLDAVLEDFAAATPEANAATRAFQAENKPTRIKIGTPDISELDVHVDPMSEGALDPSLGTYEAGEEFTLTLTEGSTEFEATYTTLEGDEQADVAASLVAQINAFGATCPYQVVGYVSGSSFTISIKSSWGTPPVPTILRVLCAVEGYLYLLPNEINDGEGFAAGMVPLRKQDDDWYPFSVLTREVAMQKSCMDYIETTRKISFFATFDPRIKDVLTIPGETDYEHIAEYAKDKAYIRSAIIYHSQANMGNSSLFVNGSFEEDAIPQIYGYVPSWVVDVTTLTKYIMFGAAYDSWADVAWIAARIWVDPDVQTCTWKFATLPGVTVDTFTDSQWTRIKSFNCNLYNEVGGTYITEEGVTAEGEFIDIITGIDWITSRMQERIFRNLKTNLKVPMDDDGIGSIGNDVASILQWAQRTKYLTKDLEKGAMGYRLTLPARASLDPNDLADRLLKGISWDATVAGAIHAVNITGTIEV